MSRGVSRAYAFTTRARDKNLDYERKAQSQNHLHCVLLVQVEKNACQHFNAPKTSVRKVTSAQSYLDGGGAQARQHSYRWCPTACTADACNAAAAWITESAATSCCQARNSPPGRWDQQTPNLLSSLPWSAPQVLHPSRTGCEWLVTTWQLRWNLKTRPHSAAASMMLSTTVTAIPNLFPRTRSSTTGASIFTSHTRAPNSWALATPACTMAAV